MQAPYVTVIEDRPILSAEYHLSFFVGPNPLTLQQGLSAIAELFVK